MPVWHLALFPLMVVCPSLCGVRLSRSWLGLPHDRLTRHGTMNHGGTDHLCLTLISAHTTPAYIENEFESHDILFLMPSDFWNGAAENRRADTA